MNTYWGAAASYDIPQLVAAEVLDGRCSSSTGTGGTGEQRVHG